MMRVVLLTAAGPWSGAEVHTINLASVLKERGHDVVIVELGRRRYAEVSQPLPCPVLHLDLGPGPPEGVPLDALGFRTWARLFNSLEGDIAVFAKGTLDLGNIAMEAAARLRFQCYLTIEHYDTPLSKRVTGRYFRGLVPGLGLWWYRRKLSGYLRSVFPQRVICVSHALASTLRNDYGFPSRKLIAVHSGVDTDIFVPSPDLRNQARADWGIPETALVFGTLGRLSPMKNHTQLIKAFSQLCKNIGGRDFRLVIVGDGPLRSTLEELADASGVRERIVFGGFSGTPQKIYPAFDFFCFPSTTGETLGIALLEAMSCGCTPIAAAVGGVPEIVNDPQLGWLIRSGDENELLSAMRLAAELDNKSLKQLGSNARERVLHSFKDVDRFGELANVIETSFESTLRSKFLQGNTITANTLRGSK